MSHSTFACNWQNRFWDSDPIIAHFPSNKGGNSNIRIPRDFVELHLAPCMRVVCCMLRLGSSHTSKQNVLSLILLIPLTKLTNQNKGICRDLILYPLQLRPSFPNDVKILRPKVGFGPNRLKIDLRSFNMKNITFYEQINLILKNKRQGHVYGGTDLCT